MLIPYLLSWLVRSVRSAETWAPIVDTASLVFLGMMTLTFVVARRFAPARHTRCTG